MFFCGLCDFNGLICHLRKKRYICIGVKTRSTIKGRNDIFFGDNNRHLMFCHYRCLSSHRDQDGILHWHKTLVGVFNSWFGMFGCGTSDCQLACVGTSRHFRGIFVVVDKRIVRPAQESIEGLVSDESQTQGRI